MLWFGFTVLIVLALALLFLPLYLTSRQSVSSSENLSNDSENTVQQSNVDSFENQQGMIERELQQGDITSEVAELRLNELKLKLLEDHSFYLVVRLQTFEQADRMVEPSRSDYQIRQQRARIYSLTPFAQGHGKRRKQPACD